MTNEVEKLDRLLARAVATLERATTVGEFLEAQQQADVAYTAAKLAARLMKIKDDAVPKGQGAAGPSGWLQSGGFCLSPERRR